MDEGKRKGRLGALRAVLSTGTRGRPPGSTNDAQGNSLRAVHDGRIVSLPLPAAGLAAGDAAGLREAQPPALQPERAVQQQPFHLSQQRQQQQQQQQQLQGSVPEPVPEREDDGRTDHSAEGVQSPETSAATSAVEMAEDQFAAFRCCHVTGCPAPAASVASLTTVFSQIFTDNSLLPVATTRYKTVYCLPADHSMKDFILTSFRTITFVDGVHVVSWCTCETSWRDKAALFDCDTSAHTRAAGLDTLGHACPHARALQMLWKWQPTQRSAPLHPIVRPSEPDPPAKIQQLSFPGASQLHLRCAWLVGSPLSGEAAVVYQQAGAYRCSACSASKRCTHVKQVTGDQGAAPEPEPDTEAAVDELASLIADYIDTETGKLQVKSVSRERIGDGVSTKLGVYPEYTTLPGAFVPDPQLGAVCGCGRPWKEACLMHSSPQRKPIVFSLTWFREVDVFHRLCPCGEKLHSNFGPYGILNLNNMDLFSHELLHWYSVQMATAPIPFYALWRSVVESYADRGLLPENEAEEAVVVTGRRHGVRGGPVAGTVLAPDAGPLGICEQLRCAGQNDTALLLQLRACLAAGADPNVTNAQGQTPLMLGALSGSLEACRVLLSAGADHAAMDKEKRTALRLAVQAGHRRVVEELMSAPAAAEAPHRGEVGGGGSGPGGSGPGGSGPGGSGPGGSGPGGGGRLGGDGSRGDGQPLQVITMAIWCLYALLLIVVQCLGRWMAVRTVDDTHVRKVKGSAAKGYGFFINKRAVFQEAWLNFIALQEPDITSAFQCRCDSEQCMYVIADGILLGVRKEKSHLSKPWGPAVMDTRLPGSLHRQRTLLSRPARGILQRMCTSGEQPAVTVVEYESLLTAADNNSCADLKPYLASYAPAGVAVPADSPLASPQLRSLLLAITSESPVCAFVPGIVHSLIVEMLAAATPSLQSLLKLTASAPLLGPFVAWECNSNGGFLPQRTQKVLRLLLSFARAAYRRVGAQVYTNATIPRRAEDVFAREDPVFAGGAGVAATAPTGATAGGRATAAAAGGAGVAATAPTGATAGGRATAAAAGGGATTSSPEEEFMRSGFFYPSMPWQYFLGRYMADHNTQTTGQRRCTKYKYDSKNLSPGLFVMHCLKCGVCLGFHMLRNAESPQALFEVLITRWPQPPKVVVYDNNCHAHAYFLNREPEFVTNTLFVIDKTHFRGHTGCCKAYDIARYSSLVSLNSQLAEQRNAKLAMLKSHCAYMTQPLFLVYVRHFLYMTDKLSKRAENAR